MIRWLDTGWSYLYFLRVYLIGTWGSAGQTTQRYEEIHHVDLLKYVNSSRLSDEYKRP